MRRKTALFLVMCNDRDGKLLTDKAMVAARWREHFKVLLNGGNGRATDKIFESMKTDRLWNLHEIKAAIRRLKNKKASEKDELPSKLLMHGSEQLYHRII